ncbi:hypothetical protein AWM68_02415 [Fictibacillus phosphorivorans]|uniref:Uncharacterized protein n=1 Tax=Fictibacillus phosphorivorans TaxID=1221500 RepID=A0A161TRV5_9BACL|nr:hypothetical protein [Fictibacillus phosphorivorans]KZE69141.1 hypothetical protein AWM68_02415 [Fictibacillus phosphorivorans]
MKKFLVLVLFLVVAFTSLFPNYNLENLFTPQKYVYELSSASIDKSTIIGEYPTESKKLISSVQAFFVSPKMPFEELRENLVLPTIDPFNTKILRLTPFKFQSNYL